PLTSVLGSTSSCLVPQGSTVARHRDVTGSCARRDIHLHAADFARPGRVPSRAVRAFFLLTLLGTGAALGSTAVRLDTPALVAPPDWLGGNAAPPTSVGPGDHRRLVTHGGGEVRDPWKGTAAGRITVVQPGGERDGIGQRVSGVAPLSSGERVVLFLERSGP